MASAPTGYSWCGGISFPLDSLQETDPQFRAAQYRMAACLWRTYRARNRVALAVESLGEMGGTQYLITTAPEQRATPIHVAWVRSIQASGTDAGWYACQSLTSDGLYLKFQGCQDGSSAPPVPASPPAPDWDPRPCLLLAEPNAQTHPYSPLDPAWCIW
jgi:hypothetical protein